MDNLLFQLLPQLKDKLNGLALRVPTQNVSLVDIVIDVKTNVSVEDINVAFKQAAQGHLNGILDYSESLLVSSDYIRNENSTIVDGLSTMVMGERKVKIIAWYDNEWGYSCRVVDLVRHVGKLLKVSLNKSAYCKSKE